MEEQVLSWFQSLGFSAEQARLVLVVSEAILLLAAAMLVKLVTRLILVRISERVAARTTSTWDDALLQSGFFFRVSNWPPLVLLANFIPIILRDNTEWLHAAQRLLDVAVIAAILLIVVSLVDAGTRIYQSYEIAKRIPATGFAQVVKLLVVCGALIQVISILLGKEPWVLLSGIGAMTAVLMLVFKDTILGFVGGIQLIANDMLRPGDWIEMPKYGADGDVLEITLTTVKVQNWDKTITTIPTYSLIADSFKNWRGMRESGGRRIKRSVFIDVNSIRFCTPEMIERFRKIYRIRDYVEAKEAELREYNQRLGIDESSLADGRRMTNIGTFRHYLTAYLRQHPTVNQDMTLLVRQLQPTNTGLPIEIYAFSSDQRWAYYESIQADIFDHIYAVLPVFELKPFQDLSGRDLLEGMKLIAQAQGLSPQAMRDKRIEPGTIRDLLADGSIAQN
jgi:miniconductance mechanosensitive channel